MLSKLTCLAIVIVFVLPGCTKQIAHSDGDLPSDEMQASAPLQSLVADRGWYSYYAGAAVSGTDTLFADSTIAGGVLRMPFYSDSRDVFTISSYDILANHWIPGDSVIFELQVKNPKDGYHSDWDVLVDIKGTKQAAHVGFVADSSYSQYTQFFVGNAVFNGAPQLVYDFENFTTLRLILKNNRATMKLNGRTLLSFAYGAQNRIGQIKTIDFAGKGYLSCTSVKLYNSYTNRLILSETFSKDGKSTVVYK